MHQTNERPSGFIKSHLTKFAQQNPEVEITVSPRPGKHPCIVGHFVNGKQRSVCVRNDEPLKVLERALQVRNGNGEKQRRVTKPVTSINPSVRGVWSPYHGTGMSV